MQSWGLTDVGCVRKQNQDAFHIEKLGRGALLCVVCDGPCAGGGHAGAWPGAVRAVDSGGAAADDACLSSARARHRHVGMGREGASPL